ncbi:hypothetical protein GJAV_G00168860 [Gymnothorax javanicus]|nr:hypothetical protein GJAV_G00168860 [Gymnothorax javanicus]
MTTVDLHYKKNNEAHRTNEISTDRLIIRRGKPFLLTLHSSGSKTLNPKSLELTVQTGPKPSLDLGTKSVFDVSQKSSGKKPWEAKVQEASGTSVTLIIKSPADASIGKYTFSVKTHPNATEGHSTGTFVLLFNPWCKEDTVYLENEAERQEYVMNEQGIQYRGTSDHIQGSAWDFGQFEEDILDICLKILDLNPKCAENAAEDFSARGDPIYVGRVVSSMINSNDDRGVLQGNWTCAFFDGVSPTGWTGSVDILRQWNASDGHPVKYGQCWVFGGVMCTVMRCLGIPCRLVTNFDCACDSHGNLLIDFYISENGTDTEDMNEDSIWNYHVWVEAWMKRPDLPGGSLYDGWQAADPTPQELSDGVYCCGPAPVKAIREGHTDLKYDLPFIFAEVNADRVIWKIKPDGSHVKMHTDTHTVGKNISTKSVGSNKRLDITETYKYPEGSAEERQAFDEALKRTKQLKKPEAAEEEPPPEISVEIEECSIPVMGNDIDLVIKLKGHTARNLMIFANAKVKLYNGKLHRNICSEEQTVQMLADKELMVPFKIPYCKYGGHLIGDNSIKVMAVVDYKENRDDVYYAEKNVALESPPFSLTVNENAKAFRSAQAELTFENPCSVELTNCTVTFCGSGLLMERATTKFQSLGPSQLVRIILSFMPYRSGPRMLMACFDCDQFQNIRASCEINVQPSFA